MDTRTTENELNEFICETCGHIFGLGEKIYILHLWIWSRDVCRECRDRIIQFADTRTTTDNLAL